MPTVNGNGLFSADTKLMVNALNSVIELLTETKALLIEIKEGINENKAVLNEIKEAILGE